MIGNPHKIVSLGWSYQERRDGWSTWRVEMRKKIVEF